LTEDREWLRSTEPKVAAAASEPDDDGSDEVEREYKVEVDGRLHAVRVIGPAGTGGSRGAAPAARRPPRRERAAREGGGGGAGETLTSPLQGTVLRVAVEKGQEIEEGALICVIEAMKMENEIAAHRSGTVTELNVAEGGSVGTGDAIAKIE
jgi:acetyl-CoA/propionyl-CoA carboxylase biotin carboxyl carrier protein